MIKALDLEIESMEIESLIKGGDLDGALDLLEKGLGHKYMRRIPTGNPSHPYRYFYSATHGAIPGANPVVGEKVRLDDSGQGGHAEVTHVHDNGEVTLKHDVTGNTMRVHKDRLRDMALEQHGPAIQDRFSRLQRVHEQALKTGTARQQERASAALNAHNAAFNAGKYEKNKAHADALSGRYLNDKFVTTHQHHEAMGAHVVAANLAPSDEARASHMGMVQKHSAKLDELKQKIDADRAANPPVPNPAPHTPRSASADRVTRAPTEEEGRRYNGIMGASTKPGYHDHAMRLHYQKAQEHIADAKTWTAKGTHEGHSEAALHHQGAADSLHIIAKHANHPEDRADALNMAKQHESERTSQEALAEKAKGAKGGDHSGKTHDDIVKDFKQHFMGTGVSAPKMLHDAERGAKFIGDKQTMTKEELKAAPEKIKALKDMAKERGGKTKAMAALREARDHWRYMSKLHEGRYNGTRYKTGKDTAEKRDEHLGNMSGARMVRDHLDSQLSKLRRGVPDSTKPATEAAATKPTKERSADRNKIQRMVGKKNPLGAPNNASDRFGPKSFWEGLDNFEGENEGSKQTTHPAFEPGEHKDLPKGSTLAVYAPHNEKDPSHDFHVYRHEGHGELKPIGNSSKEVNTLADLKGHDVRVSEPGDTRTGNLFADDTIKRLKDSEAKLKGGSGGSSGSGGEGGGGKSPVDKARDSKSSDAQLADSDQEHKFAETTGVGKAHTAHDIVSGKAPYKVGDHLSPLHDSAEHAYTIDDYPYGRDLRTQKRVWVETKKGHGQRIVEQTKNPKSGGWNKPHPGIYSTLQTASFDENGHLQPHHFHSARGSPEHADQFLREHGAGLKPSHRQVLQRYAEHLRKNTGVAQKSDPIGDLVKAERMLATGEDPDLLARLHGQYDDGMRKSLNPEDMTTTGVLGATTLGKTIYADFDNTAHKGFDHGDHCDAAELHANMINRLSSTPTSDDATWWAVAQAMSFHEIQQQKHKDAAASAGGGYGGIAKSTALDILMESDLIQKGMSPGMLSSAAYAASTMAKSQGTPAAHKAAHKAHKAASGAFKSEGNNEMAKKHGDVAARHYKEAMAGKTPRMSRSNPTAQTNAAIAHGAKAGMVRKSEVVEGWGVVVPEGSDDRMTHRPRMQRPAADEILIVKGAPVVTGPNQAQTRQLATARAKDEMRKALLASFRAELMALEADNGLVQAVKKRGSAYHRLSVPTPIMKSLNTGEPDPNEVVLSAAEALLQKASGDARLRQGLAVLGVTKAHLRQALDAMALTADRVYAGLV